MHENLYSIAAIGVAFILAGFVKGMIGMGLPTVALGILGAVMTPAQGAALLVLPTIITNTWQLFSGPSFIGLVRRLWPFLIAVGIGTLSGFGLMSGPNAHYAVMGLGAVLVVYSLLGLFAVRFAVPARHEKWMGPVVGALTGLIGAATGLFSVPAIPYLQALGLKRDDLIQALGLFFSVSKLALAVNLVRDGFLQLSIWQASVIALGAAGVGMIAGTWARERVSAEVFRVCFFVGMLALGAHLALRDFL
jgi:uncharacterized membrane protein YfcA